MGDIDALVAERDHLESEFRRLEEKQEILEKEQTEINRQTEAAAGDTEALARIKIETEQMAEAKHANDRLMAQTKERLSELDEIIDMQRQSDMT